ncbi:MAG: sigma-70 family RNA polymerase sigma factor [Myxococcota bacterium]
MLEFSLPEAFNPVAMSCIALAGIMAVLASRVLSALAWVPMRVWRRGRGLEARGLLMPEPSSVAFDPSDGVAQLRHATRMLADELVHARPRLKRWHDGERPGLVARWLGVSTDDDFGPTIELFGEVSRWLRHASELVDDDDARAPEVQHACARVRGLVMADGDLGARVDGILEAIADLDARLSAAASSPYRDRRPVAAAAPGSTGHTESDEENEPSSRVQVLAQHEAVFRTVAARYADDDDGREDLRQDIRLAVWLALPKHRGDASLSTYVQRIAHYCGARFGRRQFKAEAIEEPVDPSPTMVEQLHDAERRAALREALTNLPERQREALELLLTGLSYREVAGRLGITESNASVRIARARKQLRAQLVPIFA